MELPLTLERTLLIITVSNRWWFRTCTVWRPLGRDVLLCFLSEVPVTNWSAQ